MRLRKYEIVNGYVRCYGSMGKQVSEPCFLCPTVSPFKDKMLDDVVDKLNASLMEAKGKNNDPDRRLTFLLTSKGIVVTWEATGGQFLTEEDNSEEELLEALGL